MCASRGMLGCYSSALLCQKTSVILSHHTKELKIPQESSTSLIITNMSFQGNLALFSLVVILANEFNCFTINRIFYIIISHIYIIYFLYLYKYIYI